MHLTHLKEEKDIDKLIENILINFVGGKKIICDY
jgi:hypothetical protein